MQSSQILFPPQIFLILRTHSREHIVGVHNNMYKGIEQTEEGTVTTRGEFYTKPNGHRHTTVVNNVQCGDLTLFFTQNKEYLKKIKKIAINLI